MADTQQTQYIPKRLRRPKTGRKDRRMRFMQTADIQGEVLDNVVQNQFGPAMTLENSAVTALGTADLLSLATGSTIGLAQLSNANRILPLTFRMTAFVWTAASVGNLFSVGVGGNGFSVWIEPGDRLLAGVKDGSQEAFGYLDMLDTGASFALLGVIDVDPLRITLALQDLTDAEIIPGHSNPAPLGGARMAPDGAAGMFWGADANAVYGPGTAPDASLSTGGLDLWYDTTLLM